MVTDTPQGFSAGAMETRGDTQFCLKNATFLAGTVLPQAVRKPTDREAGSTLAPVRHQG
jgi:hypothetical protein